MLNARCEALVPGAWPALASEIPWSVELYQTLTGWVPVDLGSLAPTDFFHVSLVSGDHLTLYAGEELFPEVGLLAVGRLIRFGERWLPSPFAMVALFSRSFLARHPTAPSLDPFAVTLLWRNPTSAGDLLSMDSEEALNQSAEELNGRLLTFLESLPASLAEDSKDVPTPGRR